MSREALETEPQTHTNKDSVRWAFPGAGTNFQPEAKANAQAKEEQGYVHPEGKKENSKPPNLLWCFQIAFFLPQMRTHLPTCSEAPSPSPEGEHESRASVLELK